MGSLWPHLPFILPQASTTAPGYDAVFTVLHVIALFFTIGIFACIAFFSFRYRRGNKVNRVLPDHEGIALELTWTIIPLIILVSLFVWSTSVYFSSVRIPAGAMEVNVVGKQWMWKLQQPNGRWEMNELHVPVGRAVKLTMISEDVIHSFGVPAFRIKQDVIPGRYVQMWFQATRVGRYRVFCSQYCGTKHAIMGGYITVMEPADYQRWLATGNVSQSYVASGEQLFRELGCTGCHGPNSNVRAPSLEGIWGKPVAVQVPDEGNVTKTLIADYRYMHDSIVLPEKEIAAGYKPIMPTYRGRVTEEEMIQLIDYIRSLGVTSGTSNGASNGYVPENAANLSPVSPAQNANVNMGRYPDRDRVFQTAPGNNKMANVNMGRYGDRDKTFEFNDSGQKFTNRTGLSGNRSDAVGAPLCAPQVDAPSV
ncbi:MAG: cytochrome c oxidase subunit [Abditibacteriota bacterium]|nr:cytochrome c oxidase subunit [Abditibacteriota bacterium]